ncbi:DNA translocase FtsK [Lysinibacillus sp. OL1_EC]|uniref:FtsK/SpoIIIE family DNA translocase n=1 Tax=unclassified Lysinibacillus TaxID=2636778 RepID=UPI00103E02D3|nr:MULTISPECIES: DNA translocase FtsK [unclassified Lysinibacillus]MCM0626235.1 DNA translocase FtsK [Lysinibacillus sp. OL1_EC]MCS5502127.1 DNA translocase FtsK [Lysinibacillus sp. A4]TBV86000.1 DNA translocase FtsK [Lysinibacillus sp. OL1]UKJ46433.1 DNA translocase FtsK [Lysinibacillus sp. ACHW1.5]WGT38752.1 DNA translocase FtsK [Lysinibacillus sp. 1 U-2021]
MAVSKRKKVTKSKTTTEKKEMHPLMYEILGLLLIALAVIMIFEYGMIGRILQTIAMFLFGNLHFAVPFMLIFVALLMMIGRKKVGIKDRLILGMFLIVSSLTIFSHGILFEQLSKSGGLLSDSVLRESWRILINTDGIIHRSNALGGGMVGALLFSGLHVLFEASGAKVVAWVIFFIGLILVTGKALVPYLAEKTPDIFGKWKKKHRDKKKNTPKKPNNRRSRVESGDEVAAVNQSIDMPEQEEEIPHEPIISAFTQNVSQEREVLDTTHLVENELEEATDDVQIQGTDAVENADYQLPSYNLLQLPPQHDQSGEYSVIQANAKKLEQTLQSFGVKAKVTQVHLGPAVTKYEILPDIGVKVSKIVNLQDDLALALAAKDIRMEAPIPGKSAIGIEVPNSEVAIVTLREVLESKDGAKPEALLQVAFGRDITGQAVLAELNKMPHLLVAGSTGSGKSVCINGIVVSILMRTKPHEVKLMMIDPKMVELNVYNGIPHLLAPVVTDARKASQALKKVVSEMERRYDLFSHTGTRNIEGYNAHVQKVNDQTEEKHPKLPYIVVIVDELADLMMVASSDVEDSITRLAQMARAAGIHLIIATQRPSVDVLTGVIKANIPSRIAFAVSSAIDSRTILDMGGAERLLGRGDMLFLPAGASKPKRVQGAFLSDQEVEAVVHFVIEQQKAQYQEEMIPTEEETILEETDDLYDEAVQLVVNMQTASVSMLQRRFRIGYSRAARIVDQMEQRGIVGPPEGSKPRQVLVHQYDN